MNEWWNELGTYNQVLFVIAASMTVFMTLQLLMLFLGTIIPDSSFDSEVDIDSEFDVSNDGGAFEIFGLKLLNLRVITTFVAIGSWTIFAFNGMMHTALATIFGLLIGAGAGVAMAWVLKTMFRMQSSGNFEIETTVGKVGEVYLSIPPARSGVGKVTITLTERMVELEAMTAGEVALATSTPIKVTGIVSENIVLVEPLSA